jgi:hypothetical protein
MDQLNLKLRVRLSGILSHRITIIVSFSFKNQWLNQPAQPAFRHLKPQSGSWLCRLIEPLVSEAERHNDKEVFCRVFYVQQQSVTKRDFCGEW